MEKQGNPWKIDPQNKEIDSKSSQNQGNPWKIDPQSKENRRNPGSQRVLKGLNPRNLLKIDSFSFRIQVFS